MTMAIIFTSVHHGNTRELAGVLAAELSATVYAPEKAETEDLSGADLVGLGSGIYFGRHHRQLLRFVDQWQHPPARVFIFSTAGLPFLRRLQHAALRNRLRRRGCEVVAEFCCRGWDTVGPLWLMGGINRRHPSQTDLQRAAAFARQLAAKCPPQASPDSTACSDNQQPDAPAA